MEAKQFIGQYEVEGVLELTDGEVSISFVDEKQEPLVAKRSLFEVIVSEAEVPNAEIHDIVRHTLATKIISDAAHFGLSTMDLTAVVEGAKNLVHNMAEDAIGKAFGCATSKDIPVAKLIG
jgi:hypothetical protein